MSGRDTVAARALDALRRDFGGSIVEPGAAEYEQASRSVLAAGRPLCVLRPATVADVRAVVGFAAGTGLALSVRGGGHGFAGFGTNDGGIVLDLGGLAEVEIVDEERHVVRIGGGATWGQVAAALGPHGLAISAGDTAGVGVGGLTSSGGIGWKVRKHGLALDNVVAVEVVTADARVVRAGGREHPELFWAVRGGGGNVGVVTAFEFLAHRTTDVHFGSISFPASAAATVLPGWSEAMRAAPEELTSVAEVANPLAGGPDAPVTIRVAVDSDDPALAARVLDPIRRLGPVVADTVAPVPYAATLEDGGAPPPGIRFVARSAFVDGESAPDLMRLLAEARASRRSPVVVVRSLGGAVSRVPDDATAYAHRRAELLLVTFSVGPEAAVEAARPAVEALWGRLAPHVHGAYANFQTSATDEDSRAIYPAPTYERLAAVKHRYDPANLFARNHNVRPAGTDRSVATQSIESRVDPRAVLALLTDPRRIPDWAPAFADAVTGDAGSGWLARKGDRSFALRVVRVPDAGTVDYLREVAPGREGGAYLRVVPRPGDGSVVVMTVPLVPGAAPAATAATLRGELTTLVGLAGCR